MKRKNRCPYCGKKISYGSRFSSRRKAEYVCQRCGKESRVVINKQVILVFIICAVISVASMTLWIMFDLTSNPLGILIVAVPLIIFGIISPNFVRFEPLKKYKKSMEAKRAGIEYSDNLMISELDENSAYSDSSGQFKINNDVFNQIKADRNASREINNGENLVSDSEESEPKKRSYVNVADNVTEKHSSSEDAPLKKIHSEGARINRSRHYIEAPEASEPKADERPLRSENRKPERQEPNKYSANRRF